jgi:hypothetical protein
MQQRAALVAAPPRPSGAGTPPLGTDDEMARLAAAVRRDD